LTVNGGPAWRDVDDVATRVSKLEKSVSAALSAMKAEQASALKSAIAAEHKSTVDSVKNALKGTAEFLNDREVQLRKEFRLELASTASAAASSARNAEAIAKDQLDAAVETIRSHAYFFAHGA
jgi:hypothetical protein